MHRCSNGCRPNLEVPGIAMSPRKIAIIAVFLRGDAAARLVAFAEEETGTKLDVPAHG